MHISVHKFFSFNVIVCYVLQREITHKTTPLRVVRIFFQIVAHISRRVLFWQCTARWPESKVITKFFPIWQPLRCLPPWLWFTKNDFLFAGYGNIVPVTVQERLFCVLYALIGIPGTCLTRKSIGDKITELFTKLITNRLLWETRFEKITSDSKSGAKSYVDNDCGNCGLSTTINGSLGLLETQGVVICRVFFLNFHDFEYNWFGDYFPQFKNNTDYSLVLLASVGLAFESSIFCSMNKVFEQ